MKTRSRIIAVLGILILCAGLFVACNSEVSESSAVDTSKTAYLNFGDYSKSISSTSIAQKYTIKPVSEVYWVYHAEKKDNAGTTGAMDTDVYLPVKDAYADVVTELQGLNGTVGPFSVGKWQFTLIGYTDVTNDKPNENYIAVNVKHGGTAETKYYYGQIYSASSSVITLSESTAANPQAISVEVIFAGSGDGTVKVEPGYFYWVNDNGGDVEEDGEVLKMHLTFAPTSGVATEKYITLDAKDYDNSTDVKYRYEIANATEATFALAAGDYDTTFAIERWSTGETPSYISTLSGASGVIVKVYAKQTLVIDAQFLESSFGYVTFNGVTPAPVLVQRLVLDTAAELQDGKRVTSGASPQKVTHDGLSVTYPVGTILTAETRSAIDGQTSDATTGFVYTGETPTGFTLQDDEANLGYELTVNVDQSNTTVLTIEKNVGAGREVRAVYHNGSPMEKLEEIPTNPTAETYNYNASTGLLTLYVQHASPIDVVYVPEVVTDMVASVTHGTTVTTYATFEAAAAVAQNGDTITLLKNVTLGSQKVTFNGGKAITLDLAGYTLLCGTAGHAFDIDGANLTVQNGTINGNDKQVFNVYGRTENGEGNYSVLTIAANAEIVNAGCGVCVFPASGKVGYDTEINLNGSITGECGIFVSGNLANDKNTPTANDEMIASNVINLGNGSSISTTDQAIAMNGGATVNVVDGVTLIGSEAIGLKRGTLNVTGGTLRATGDYVVPTANNNGTEASGVVVSITSTYNYAGRIVANITGGTFVSANGHALSIQKTDNPFSAEALAVTVSGGIFTAGSNENAKAVYAAEGTVTAFISGGSFSTDPNYYVASGYEGVLNEDTQYYDVGEVVEVIIKKDGYADQGMSLKTFASNVNNGETYEDCIVELTRDVVLDDSWQGIGVDNSSTKTFKGVFDGKEKSITLSSRALFYSTTGSTIKNLTVVMNGNSSIVYFTEGMTFDNVITNGNIVWNSSNSGAFVVYAKNGNVTFDNCTNKANILVNANSDAYDAIFVGYCYGSNPDYQNFVFNNCVNSGNVHGARLAMFIGNTNKYKVALTISNCSNSGTISTFNHEYNFNLYSAIGGSNNETDFKVNNISYGGIAYSNKFNLLPSAVNDEIINNTGTISKGSPDETFALTRNSDNSFTVIPATSADVKYYIVRVGTYIGLKAGGTSRTYATERIEASSSSFVTTIKDLKFVDKTWVDNNPGAVQSTLAGNTVYTLGADQYYLIKEADSGLYTVNGNPTSSVMINVVAYSESDVPLTSASLLSL